VSKSWLVKHKASKKAFLNSVRVVVNNLSRIQNQRMKKGARKYGNMAAAGYLQA
jgi:hypothetical protein